MEILFLFSVVAFFAYRNWQYKKSAYYQITKNSYFSTRFDKGKYGEYLTYKALRYFERNGGKFLFNLYLPKANNETTEIDVLLICPKGVFVFESKNFSGWIFGNEAHRDWTQTLPRGKGRSHKERFYNPVMQNATHIKHLRCVVHGNIPMRSIIVFSDNCTLKDITINSEVRVINCYEVASAVNKTYNESGNFLTHAEIDNLYDKLYPYTQVSCKKKEQHTNNIQKA